ncbi:nuclease [Bacillus sp. FJAT-27225]|uniref:nuclease-related domain-containing protein n=1 Tax=Bacillus sp. FJAT-27225 TaxID=1743144 RepID=UPI00080C30A5|nr:nuclease-related domain-containing protein [Bacillus sp. FJAT-27225]OCA91401.1 nuclease [Bacillus sp. FJAT-27225]
MPKKMRTESRELRVLRSLDRRMDLEEAVKQQYSNLKKGYEGELLFDARTELLTSDCIILNDLLLQINGKTFQIDTLIIFPNEIFIFEVKNFEGEFFYADGKLFKKPQAEVADPLLQLSRTETSLRQLLKSIGFNVQVEGSVVFINPEFTLYNAPLDKPIILPTYLNPYFKKLNTKTGKLRGYHTLLADKLISMHLENSPFEQLPAYEIEHVRPGMLCQRCDSFDVYVEGKKLNCKNCSHTEKVEEAVMRHVEEFKLLFPDQQIKTILIHNWCGIVSMKWIKSILEKNFKMVRLSRWSYFE